MKPLTLPFALALFYSSLSHPTPLCAAGQSPQTPPPAAEAQPPLHITFREALQHRLGDRSIITSAESPDAPWFIFIRVDVIVSPDGSVISAIAKTGPQEFFAQAVAFSNSWRYQPFERDGHPLTVQFIDTVSIPRPERRSPTPVPFPEIRDWNSLIITLDRESCILSCLARHLEIHGDGTVIFSGSSDIADPSERRGQISRDAVVALVDQFRAADYFSLLSMYRMRAFDGFTCTISIAFDQSQKSVDDHSGAFDGMPRAVNRLEHAIDLTASSAQQITRAPAAFDR